MRKGPVSEVLRWRVRQMEIVSYGPGPIYWNSLSVYGTTVKSVHLW